jgi:hypothetical protein
VKDALELGESLPGTGHQIEEIGKPGERRELVQTFFADRVFRRLSHDVGQRAQPGRPLRRAPRLAQHPVDRVETQARAFGRGAERRFIEASLARQRFDAAVVQSRQLDRRRYLLLDERGGLFSPQPNAAQSGMGVDEVGILLWNLEAVTRIDPVRQRRNAGAFKRLARFVAQRRWAKIEDEAGRPWLRGRTTLPGFEALGFGRNLFRRNSCALKRAPQPFRREVAQIFDLADAAVDQRQRHGCRKHGCNRTERMNRADFLVVQVEAAQIFRRPPRQAQKITAIGQRDRSVFRQCRQDRAAPGR